MGNFQLIQEMKLPLLCEVSAMRKQGETIMKSHHNLSLHVRDAQLLMLIFKLYSVLTYSVHASKSSFPCLHCLLRTSTCTLHDVFFYSLKLF